MGETTDDIAEPVSEREDDTAPTSERSPFGAFFSSPYSNLLLFLATVASTFYVGAGMVERGGPLRGWVFAVPLLAILVTHEMGHWVQARRHRVEASLPYFIPMPILSLIGTMGAVIAMRGRIKTRNALLDIGASGPIAGMIIAVPVLIVGLKLSTVEPIPLHGGDEGQSLFYLALKRLVIGPIPDGSDVFLHPTALAGWAGLLLTMLNLVPAGQLDGGHVAYALFGRKQDRYSRYVRYALLLVAVVVGALAVVARLRAHAPWSDVLAASLKGISWLFWFGLLTLFAQLSGPDHPPTEPSELSFGRKVVASLTLVLFFLLFMPVPFSSH